jgi:hypothetical protein
MLAYPYYALVFNNTKNSNSSFQSLSFKVSTSSTFCFYLNTESSFKEEFYLYLLYNNTFNFNFNFKDKSPPLPPLKEVSIKTLAKSFALLV